ncbi:MAG: hypothetical protein IJI88_01930 [Atopobiaceae bacterium]|nr:hypothetical protein [Atopobiaceae bacterium]
MRKSSRLSTVALAGMLALGLAFLPACSSGTEPEPAAEAEAEEREAPEEEQATEEAELEPEVLGAWIATNESGTSAMGSEYTLANELDEHRNVVLSERSGGIVTTSEYDEYGNVTHEVTTFDGGSTYDMTHEYVLDENGRPLSDHAVEVDNDPDYPGTTTYYVTYEYHANGVLKSQTRDMESVVVIEGAEDVATNHYVVEYDEQGYEVLFRYEGDYGNSETTTVWEYDDAGNPVKAVRTYTSGDETYELTSTFECDENGCISAARTRRPSRATPRTMSPRAPRSRPPRGHSSMSTSRTARAPHTTRPISSTSTRLSAR